MRASRGGRRRLSEAEVEVAQAGRDYRSCGNDERCGPILGLPEELQVNLRAANHAFAQSPRAQRAGNGFRGLRSRKPSPMRPVVRTRSAGPASRGN